MAVEAKLTDEPVLVGADIEELAVGPTVKPGEELPVCEELIVNSLATYPPAGTIQFVFVVAMSLQYSKFIHSGGRATEERRISSSDPLNG